MTGGCSRGGFWGGTSADADTGAEGGGSGVVVEHRAVLHFWRWKGSDEQFDFRRTMRRCYWEEGHMQMAGVFDGAEGGR